MDTAQLILTIAVVVLAALFVFLGIQVFFILKEIRKSVQQVNQILQHANEVTENIARPIADFSSVLSGIKTGASLINLFTKRKHQMEEDEDEQ